MRKLAAIMFTDIVGYTALMGKDEALALKLLDRNREVQKPLIEKHNGELLKEMGDGILASFASAVEATECALAIQSAVRGDVDLNVRIGIHVGDVMLKEGDIFGEGVNVASRLEPLAEPGGIYISERVYDDIRNRPDIETTSLGEHSLKNVDHLIEVYALTGAGLPAPLPEKFAPAKGADAPGIFSPARLVRYAIGVAAITVAGYMISVQRLEARLPVLIAVADFVNETDDPDLNGMSGMLTTSLEQSRRLSVLSRSRLFDILKQMGRDEVEFIDEALGREIASQGHIEALATATIRKFDETYTIDLKVLDVERDVYLFASSEEGLGKGSIPAMLDRLSDKIRRELKESNRAILRNSVEIAKVTTPNLEAYKHFFKGEEYINKLMMEEAQEEFRLAVASDSTFGLAWYRLVYVEWWESDGPAATASLQKAVALLDRIPEKEQYMVRALKVSLEEGAEAGIIVAQVMEKIYPNDKEMLFLIGDMASHTEQYPLAEEYLERVLEIDPTFMRGYNHLANVYGSMGQLQKGLDLAQRVGAVSDSLEYHFYLWLAYSWANQDESSEQEYRKILAFSSETNNPRAWDMLGQLGWSLTRQGRYSEAENVFRQGLEIHPDQYLLLDGLGWSLDTQEQYAKAEKIFRQTLEIRPDYSGSLNGLRSSFYGQKNYSAADSIEQELLKLAKSGSPASISAGEVRLGDVDLLQAQYLDAEEHFIRALALDSLGAHPNRHLAYLRVAQGRFEDAEIRIRKAIAADSLFNNVNLMAWVLIAGERDIDVGISLAHQAVKLRTDFNLRETRILTYVPLAEHSLGLAFLKRGRYLEAVKYLEQAVELVPERQAVADDLELARKAMAAHRP